MRLTKKVKREIETAILQANDALKPIVENTGLKCISVSVLVGWWHAKEDVAVYIHDEKGIVVINKRDEINGLFDSDKWKNRKNPGEGGGNNTGV